MSRGAILTDELLPPAESTLGAWVRQRLREDLIAWLTTIDPHGLPQPNPVSFAWEDGTFLVYSLASARRVANIRARPAVSLHLDAFGVGSDAIVFLGQAEIDPSAGPADQHTAFMAKYRDHLNLPPERWAAMFPIALRIHPSRFRGHHGAGPR